MFGHLQCIKPKVIAKFALGLRLCLCLNLCLTVASLFHGTLFCTLLCSELWLNVLALVLIGIFASMAIVPTFDIIIDIAE